VITYTTGKATFECPFCKKRTVVAFHHPAHREARTSRISAGAKTKWIMVPESYDILSGCSNCGATKEEIQDKIDGKEKITHEERVKRLKERGLPLVIESKH